MLEIPTQTDGATALSAVKFNSIANELENTLEASGQTLESSPSQDRQLIEAIKRLSGNGEWRNIIDYLAGSQTLGSDGELYRCVVDTGPTFANAVDPVGDNTGVWTSPTKRYSTTIPFDGNGTWTTITNGVINLVRFGDTVTMTAYADQTQGANVLLSSQTIPVGYRPNLDIYIRNTTASVPALALAVSNTSNTIGVNEAFQALSINGWGPVGAVNNPIATLSWQSKDFIQ